MNALYYVAVLLVPILFGAALPGLWRRILGGLAAAAVIALQVIGPEAAGGRAHGVALMIAAGVAIGAAIGELIEFRRARSAKRGWLHG
jgi:hypothetical protein